MQHLSRRVFLSALPAALNCAAGTPYLHYVRTFADTLLAKGLDTYGPRQTPLWAGVIDASTMSVPATAKQVPNPEGIRTNDRAVGGCNAYHDAVTWQVFRVLSAVTKEPRYQRAAHDAMSCFLSTCQHPKTGLLAWGEHLFYDFRRDEVVADRKWHELLEWTPPYPLLWEANAEAVKREIAGIRYHFYADDPTALFNRHAWWDRAEFQPTGGQPWIKHTGLYAYAFSFLYSKTRDPLWLKWTRGPAELYWKHRNPQTNLTLGCIGDPRPSTQDATPQIAELAYWLYKAWQLTPTETALRDRARTYMAAFDRFFYDRKRDLLVPGLALDGTRKVDHPMRIWNIGYGETGPLAAGRIAAYIGGAEKDAAMLDLARRIALMAKRAPVPDNVSQECLAFAMNLALDLFDHTREAAWLQTAREYAELAVKRFWYESDGLGLFVRAPGDHFYEAKVATGDLLAGLLRLHLRVTKTRDPKLYDWSF